MHSPDLSLLCLLFFFLLILQCGLYIYIIITHDSSCAYEHFLARHRYAHAVYQSLKIQSVRMTNSITKLSFLSSSSSSSTRLLAIDTKNIRIETRHLRSALISFLAPPSSPHSKKRTRTDRLPRSAKSRVQRQSQTPQPTCMHQIRISAE